MFILEECKAMIQERADDYGISYNQMIRFLEYMQSRLQLSTTLTMTTKKPFNEQAFLQLDAANWICESLGFTKIVSLEQIAERMCERYDADFSKIPEQTIDIVWCDYLLKNWDYKKAGNMLMSQAFQDDLQTFTAGDGNHRRIVIAIGYKGGKILNLPEETHVIETKEGLNFPVLLGYTNEIEKDTILRWTRGEIKDFCVSVNEIEKMKASLNELESYIYSALSSIEFSDMYSQEALKQAYNLQNATQSIIKKIESDL